MKNATPTNPSTVTPNLWEEESARAYATRKAYPMHPALQADSGIFEFCVLLLVFVFTLAVFASIAL